MRRWPGDADVLGHTKTLKAQMPSMEGCKFPTWAALGGSLPTLSLRSRLQDGLGGHSAAWSSCDEEVYKVREFNYCKEKERAYVWGFRGQLDR